jgi:uncharacterized membrane protein (UPF0127 family)
MIGMRYAIDAIFLDDEGQVVGIVEKLLPGRLSSYFSIARGCLELPLGVVAKTGTKCGDRVIFGNASELKSLL